MSQIKQVVPQSTLSAKATNRMSGNTSSIDLAHGMRNVFFTYSMLARVSATMS
jgi:hypothetical protein